MSQTTLCYVSWPLKALKALLSPCFKETTHHNNKVSCVCVGGGLMCTCVKVCLQCWSAFMYNHVYNHMYTCFYLCVSLPASLCFMSFSLSFCVCVFPGFEMSAFNSRPLWFLFCSAQEEADSANLSLLHRWSEIQVSPQNKRVRQAASYSIQTS